MKSTIENIQKFQDETQENQNLTINKSEWKSFLELPDSSLQKLVSDIDDHAEFKFDLKYIDLIKFSGIRMKWNKHCHEYFLYGGFQINGMVEALSHQSKFWKIDFSLSIDDEIPDDLKQFKKLNWFEKQAWADDWRYGCFLREKGIFPPKIAFFDKNWYTKINLSIEDYFKAMINSCAVKGWQYFYIDWNQEIPHKDDALIDMELAVKYLPELFPDLDLTHHKKILNQALGVKNR